MLTYRRKEGSGKLHIMGRKGGAKNRAESHKVFLPGSTVEVSSERELPGYPYSMDGWEFVGGTVEAGAKSRKRSSLPSVGGVDAA